MDATNYISLSEAAKLPILKRDGRSPDITTVWRWSLRGVRGGVKLATWFIGGARVTTAAAVQQFLDALNAGTTAPVTPSRKRRVEGAKRRLAAAGI